MYSNKGHPIISNTFFGLKKFVYRFLRGMTISGNIFQGKKCVT